MAAQWYAAVLSQLCSAVKGRASCKCKLRGCKHEMWVVRPTFQRHVLAFTAASTSLALSRMALTQASEMTQAPADQWREAPAIAA